MSITISGKDLKHMIAEGVALALQNKAPTETTVQHATHCPDCYKDVIETMNKKSDFMCADCHLPLGDIMFATKLKKCPNCGNVHLREVEKKRGGEDE